MSEQPTKGCLSAQFVARTIRTAIAFGSVDNSSNSIAVEAAHQLLNAMSWAKLKWASVLISAVSLMGVGLGLCAVQFKTSLDPAADLLAQADSASALAENGIPDSQGNAAVSIKEQLPEGALVRLGTTRLKHMGNLTNMAFAPEGAKLATWSLDYNHRHSVCIWDVKTGALLQRVEIPGANVKAFEWLADGRGIALVGDRDETSPLVWEFTQESIVPAMPPLDPGIRLRQSPVLEFTDACYAISPDGKTLAVGQEAPANVDSRVVLRQLKSSVRAQDLFTQRTLAIQAACPDLLSYTPDGKRLVVLSKAEKSKVQGEEAFRSVSVWDVATGKRLCQFRAQSPTEFANRPPVSVANKSMAVGLQDGGTALWDLESGNHLRLASDHTGRGPGEQIGTVAVVFASNGKSLATGGSDGLVKFWDCASGRLIQTMPRNPAGVECLALSPDGSLIATGYDGFLRFWDARTGYDRCPQPGHDYSLRGAVLTPDGRTAITAGDDCTLRWWDTSTGRETRKQLLPGAAWCMALSPDGKSVVVSLENQRVESFEIATGQMIASAPLPAREYTTALAFSPDAHQVVVGAKDQVVVLEWPSLQRRQALAFSMAPGEKGETECSALTISADSKWLVTVGRRSWSVTQRGNRFQGVANGCVDLWDLASGVRVRRLAETTKGPTIGGAEFCPDGQILLTGCPEATIPGTAGVKAQDFRGPHALLDPTRPSWNRSFDDATLPGAALWRHSMVARWSPDGRTLFESYASGEIVAYEVATGEAKRTLVGHLAPAYSLAFSSNGKRLISAGRDGTALIWDISTRREEQR
jgi:WD40 repeat protein